MTRCHKAASEKIHIITWEKNYKKGEWEAASGDYSTETFFIMKYRNSREDTYLYTVQFLKRPWEKEKSFAQYIILLSKPDKAPLELSVICTDFSREAQAAIKPILTRWLQENDIGYLISLGINQITSYSYHTYEYIAETLADRNITNRGNNYRNDLVILRELITAMGHIEETETTIIVYLNPTRIFSKKEKNKIALFCFQISNRINQHYCLEKTVVISLYEL